MAARATDEKFMRSMKLDEELLTCTGSAFYGGPIDSKYKSDERDMEGFYNHLDASTRVSWDITAWGQRAYIRACAIIDLPYVWAAISRVFHMLWREELVSADRIEQVYLDCKGA